MRKQSQASDMAIPQHKPITQNNLEYAWKELDTLTITSPTDGDSGIKQNFGQLCSQHLTNQGNPGGVYCLFSLTKPNGLPMTKHPRLIPRKLRWYPGFFVSCFPERDLKS